MKLMWRTILSRICANGGDTFGDGLYESGSTLFMLKLLDSTNIASCELA